jgi:iron complex outermembrane receptor protein
MERLVLTATMRWDGSSRFSPETRWGAFPSAALAYRLTEENFIKNQNVLSDLKARVGWGVTGQQDIGANYGHLSVYGISSNTAMYQFGNNFYNMARPTAYDPNIRWEQTTTWNAGMDFGFVKDRITASVDVYYKDTKDLLNVVPTPAGANFSDQVLTNVGSIENRGIELNINTIPVKNEKLEWSFGFNVTSNVNKITKLNNQEDPAYPGVPTGGISGGVGNNIQIQSVGFPLNSFFVYQQVYGPDGKPIEGKYVDRNGDGVVNAQDLYRYKQPAPVFFYGINSNLYYGKFSAGFVIRGSQGNYVYNNVYSNLGAVNTVLSRQDFLTNASKNVLETNFNGNLQGVDNSKRLLSDYYVQNASFIRLDNLNFGYDFGDVFNGRAGLRLNMNLQNFVVITKYKGVDPEIFGGIDNNFYPRPRVITIGASLNLK